MSSKKKMELPDLFITLGERIKAGSTNPIGIKTLLRKIDQHPGTPLVIEIIKKAEVKVPDQKFYTRHYLNTDLLVVLDLLHDQVRELTEVIKDMNGRKE